MKYQSTIVRSFEMKGKGLHTGKNVTLTVEPAPEDFGIRFFRKGDDGSEGMPALASHVVNTSRCTVLGDGRFSVSTVEHFLSAAYAIGLDNLKLTVDGAELPAADGSAVPFYRRLEEAEKVQQSKEKKVIKILRPEIVSAGDSILVALPGEGLKLTVILHYAHPMVGTQLCEFSLGRDDFLGEIAPARTFGFWEEVQQLLQSDLARGGDIDNALIVMPDGFSTPLRMENEPVKHKCLDLIGDLSLTGASLEGHILSYKAGHFLNIALAKALLGGC